jgi:hypothetical protein
MAGPPLWHDVPLPVDDDRASLAVLHRSQGLGEPEPILGLFGPGHALVAAHGHNLMAVLASPAPAGVLLIDEARGPRPEAT